MVTDIFLLGHLGSVLIPPPSPCLLLTKGYVALVQPCPVPTLHVTPLIVKSNVVAGGSISN